MARFSSFIKYIYSVVLLISFVPMAIAQDTPTVGDDRLEQPVFSVPNNISTCKSNPEGMAAVRLISGTAFWLPVGHPAIKEYERFSSHPNLEKKNGFVVGCKENPFLMWYIPLGVEIDKAILETWDEQEREEKAIIVRKGGYLMGAVLPGSHLLPMPKDANILNSGFTFSNENTKDKLRRTIEGKTYCQNFGENVYLCHTGNDEVFCSKGMDDLCNINEYNRYISGDAITIFSNQITTYEGDKYTSYSSSSGGLDKDSPSRWSFEYVIGNGMAFSLHMEIYAPFSDIIEFENNLRREIYELRDPELDGPLISCWRQKLPDKHESDGVLYVLCESGNYYSYKNGELEYE
jgi:hypothetical protein